MESRVPKAKAETEMDVKYRSAIVKKLVYVQKSRTKATTVQSKAIREVSHDTETRR